MHVLNGGRLTYPLKRMQVNFMVHVAHEKLVAEIDAFLTRTGMSASYFGKKAVGNSEVVSRLRAGRTITGVTEARLRTFMAKRTEDAA